MKKLLATIALCAAALAAPAQNVQPAPLAQTNAIALSWDYPTSGITPDLVFLFYATSNLNEAVTNWPWVATWSATNVAVSSQTNSVFTMPVSPTNQAMYFTIAASNMTGVTVLMQSTNYPVLAPQLWTFPAPSIAVTPPNPMPPLPKP